MSSKPSIVPVTSLTESLGVDEPVAIAKPDEFSLDKFKSKRAPTLAGRNAADGTAGSQSVFG
jgi:hypothetical protein